MHGLPFQDSLQYSLRCIGVNGSDEAFKSQRHKWELASPLNDGEGRWIARHSINRYRDWDELRYSFRSLDKYARTFINKIQLLVNPIDVSTENDTVALQPQRPRWLRNDALTKQNVQVLSQDQFFDETARECLPSFDSLSLETQIYNTPSSVDQMVALSDDMFLGAAHSAADFYSPLFGPMFAFKRNHYNVKAINRADIPTFGEKPYLWVSNSKLVPRRAEQKLIDPDTIHHGYSIIALGSEIARFKRISLTRYLDVS